MLVVDTNVYIALFTVAIIRFEENEVKTRKKVVNAIITHLESIDIEHKLNAMKNIFFSALFSFSSLRVNS